MFGKTAGTGDRYFHPPDGGKQLRSMAEVARYYGLAAATSRGGGGKILSEEEKRELEERRAMARKTRALAHRPPPETRLVRGRGRKKKDIPRSGRPHHKIQREGPGGGGLLLPSAGVPAVSFDVQDRRVRPKSCAWPSGACGRSEGGDYVKCAGGGRATASSTAAASD